MDLFRTEKFRFAERKKELLKVITFVADFGKSLPYIIYTHRECTEIRVRHPLSWAANVGLFWWLKSRSVFQNAAAVFFLFGRLEE